MSHARKNRQDPSASPPAGACRFDPDRDRFTWKSAVLAVLVLFLFVSFHGFGLPSLPAKPNGSSFARWEFLLSWILPDEWFAQWQSTWLAADGSWALADRLPVVFTAGMMAVACLAVGRLILAALRIDDDLSRAERVSLSALAGAQGVSLYVLGLGLCGLLSERWLLFLPAAAAMAMTIVLAWRRRGEQARREARDAGWLAARNVGEIYSPWWLLAAVPFVCVLILGAMLPPVDFDVREYHLEVPKEWYQAGKIGYVPHNVYGNMPLGAEMHTVAAMSLMRSWWHGALAGKLMIALYTLAAAIGLYAAGERLATRSAGVMAAVIYLAIPWVGRVSASGLIDCALGANLLAAWYAATRARDAGDAWGRWLVLAGWLAGGAVSCKYPALLFVVAPLAVMIALSREIPRRGQGTAIFLVAVLVSCGPWFAKNMIFTGNPTYPLLNSVFGGRPADLDARWVAAHRPPSYSLADPVTYFLHVTVLSDWQSPILVILAALGAAALHRRGSPWIGPLLGFLAFYFLAWWAVTHRIDRFWVPVLPLAALLAGYAIVIDFPRPMRYILRGWLILTLLSNWTFTTLAGDGLDTRYLAPLAGLREDPLRVKKWHVKLNQHFVKNPRMKVLCVGEAMVFDLEMPIEYATVFDRSPWEEICLEENDRPREPRQILAALQERGITRVYVDWGEIARYRSPGNYGFADLVTPESFARLVKEGALAPPEKMPDHPAEVYRVPNGRRR